MSAEQEKGAGIRAEREHPCVVSGGPADGERARLATEALEALGRRDAEAFGALVHPEVEIHTSRGVKRGRQAAIEWAGKGYEHLDRRYAIDELHAGEGGWLLAVARVQYVWRDGGEVADESPIGVGFAFRDGAIAELRLIEEVGEALAALGPG